MIKGISIGVLPASYTLCETIVIVFGSSSICTCVLNPALPFNAVIKAASES